MGCRCGSWGRRKDFRVDWKVVVYGIEFYEKVWWNLFSFVVREIVRGVEMGFVIGKFRVGCLWLVGS